MNDDERRALKLFVKQFDGNYKMRLLSEEDYISSFDCDDNSCVGRSMYIWEERGYIEIIEKVKRQKNKHHSFYTAGREMYYKVRVTDVGLSMIEFDNL